MKVTVKGQVTIPQKIRQKLGIGPTSEIDFVEEDGRVYIVKKKNDRQGRKPLFQAKRRGPQCE